MAGMLVAVVPHLDLRWGEGGLEGVADTLGTGLHARYFNGFSAAGKAWPGSVAPRALGLRPRRATPIKHQCPPAAATAPSQIRTGRSVPATPRAAPRRASSGRPAPAPS